MKATTVLSLFLTLAASAGYAVPFGQWPEQKFPRLPGNQWTQSPQSVVVVSDSSVSLIWTRLSDSEGTKTKASWDWSVLASVPPTQLDRKGGDDRNLALYFVFMPPELAEASRNAGVRKMLRSREARVIMYVWGGEHARGEVLSSPYLGNRGKTIIRRSAGTGNYRESVDLEEDFVRAFGSKKTVLVGLAVSSDSDDTGSTVRARLGRINLE
ncbi:DUF3047 domain-containing protein [Aliiruegeria sabulilitoris]|uniref:DUF3047 domain-containing protein n=1 Tax=Aliiruegeria sabulilitoris TaxID=1510458 RepID=UPI000831BC28|nr:DUF3047 domain-containing protein [Aliiruegeria sabulilitoris]NDR58809.1 DUF3047 domain-containing protein [Pseudoruegeria sp. M32A2M]